MVQHVHPAKNVRQQVIAVDQPQDRRARADPQPLPGRFTCYLIELPRVEHTLAPRGFPRCPPGSRLRINLSKSGAGASLKRRPTRRHHQPRAGAAPGRTVGLPGDRAQLQRNGAVAPFAAGQARHVSNGRAAARDPGACGDRRVTWHSRRGSPPPAPSSPGRPDRPRPCPPRAGPGAKDAIARSLARRRAPLLSARSARRAPGSCLAPRRLWLPWCLAIHPSASALVRRPVMGDGLRPQ